MAPWWTGRVAGTGSAISGGCTGNAQAVLGGFENTASGTGATVSGGEVSDASGGASSVRGDQFNSGSGGAAAIAGGNSNGASGSFSSILGGFENTATTFEASVSGGEDNTATATASSVLGFAPNPERKRMPYPSPTVSTELDPNAFEIHRMVVRDDVELAYVREGIGGVLIVPDQRGFGDSPSPSQFVDMAASSRDLHALVTNLGHDRAVAGGGDWGSGVVQDMANRFPGFVIRQVVWNGVAPNVPEAYEAAGIFGSQLEEVAGLSSHMLEHGTDPDAIMERYETPSKRRDYRGGAPSRRASSQLPRAASTTACASSRSRSRCSTPLKLSA